MHQVMGLHGPGQLYGGHDRDGNALKARAPVPALPVSYPWDLRRSHLPATIHGACPLGLWASDIIWTFPGPPPGLLPPTGFVQKECGQGRSWDISPLTFSPRQGWGAGLRISDSV